MFNDIRNINNFICMCYQNINGVKSFVDGHITENPWKDWIADIIKCSLLMFNNDIKYHEYNKVYQYASILSDSFRCYGDNLKFFIESIGQLDTIKQSINLLNLLEVIKYNVNHKNEYINVHDLSLVHLCESNTKVYIENNIYTCVGLTDLYNQHYMIEKKVFDKNYIPNQKEFDFTIKDELNQEPSAQSFDWAGVGEIVY